MWQRRKTGWLKRYNPRRRGDEGSGLRKLFTEHHPCPLGPCCEALSFKACFGFLFWSASPHQPPPSHSQEMPTLSLMKDTSRNQLTDSGQLRGYGGRCQTSVVRQHSGGCRAPLSQARQCTCPKFKILLSSGPKESNLAFKVHFTHKVNLYLTSICADGAWGGMELKNGQTTNN